MKRFFKNKFVSNIIIIIIALGVILSVFPLDVPFVKNLQEYAVRLILIYLILGAFFLILSNSRLLLASFLAAGILSFFLKTFSNENMGNQYKSGEKLVSVSNYNLINIESDLAEFISQVQGSEADILCFHEVDLGWSKVLENALSFKFPFQAKLVRLDGFGIMVLSNIPFHKTDTLYFNGIPILDLDIELEGTDFSLIVTQIVPPYSPFNGISSMDQLANLSQIINQIHHPVILAGEFNQVYWSKELRSLVEQTGLLNSRRFIATLGSKIPHEHIFHSKEFICSMVGELMDSSGAHIGVEANLLLGQPGGLSPDVDNSFR